MCVWVGQIWCEIAQRIVEGLDVQPGELIEVRDHAGRWELLEELLLAIELAGATPLPELTTPAYMARLLKNAPQEYLAQWDRHRHSWLRAADRALSLTAGGMGEVPEEALAAWLAAIGRLTAIEEERRIPFLVAAIPTRGQAAALGLAPEALDALLLPALAAPAEELRREINTALAAVKGADTLSILTGPGLAHELRLRIAGRRWLADDGFVDEADREAGAIVSNLPAGSIYTTVIEDASEGELWLPEVRGVREVVLRFAAGRIVEIRAQAGAEGARAIGAWLDGHTGEPRRVSHIGTGLNPYLHQPTGWTIVDEHIHGALFLALGENRYMGGQNESSLNVDFALLGAKLETEPCTASWRSQAGR